MYYTQESLKQLLAQRNDKDCVSRSRATLVEASTTELCDDDPNENNKDDDAQTKDTGILPPHLSPDSPCTTPERRCLAGHVIGLINEQLNAFATAEDLLHVLNHDVLHLGELVLGIGELISGWGGVVGVHEL